MNVHKQNTMIFVTWAAWLALASCSSSSKQPDAPVKEETKPASAPLTRNYSQLPDPKGYEIAEVEALFKNEQAPKVGLRLFSKTCDAKFRALQKATSSKKDLREGANELVASRSENMHWCFYGKIVQMQEELDQEMSWQVRQTLVINAYSFLTPIANAFVYVFHDPRYLQWASQYYSKISGWIFFRQVTAMPASSQALETSESQELEAWDSEHHLDWALSIFARYDIDLKDEPIVDTGPTETIRAPASASPTKPDTSSGVIGF